MNTLSAKITFVFFLSFSCAFAQLKVSKNHVALDMNYTLGMKPNTVHSSEIAKRSQMPKDVLATYPVVVGKPEDITKQIEYYYILNDYQFAYQNYCAQKTSKEFFFEEVKSRIWNLADTIYLSRKPLRCGISVLGGFQSDSIPVYIVDANNNNDYSDEVIRPLRKGIMNSDRIINLSVPVTMDLYLDGKTSKEAIACYISSSSSDNQLTNLNFCFPAFRYNSFIYNGKPYILWTPIFSYTDEVFLQADKSGVPIPIDRDPIKVDQYVVLGDRPFKLKSRVGNGVRIVLEGEDYSGFDSSSKTPISAVKTGVNDLRSSQVGFKAPLVQGIKIADTSKLMISLDKLKGKYVFLDFWSTTCAPCIADFPEIMKSYDKYTRDQLEIIGVVDERSTGSAANLVKKHQLKWPNIQTNTEGTITNGFNIISYPTTFLLDKEGRIIAQNLRGEELLEKLKTLIK
jgi:thiol-disulfide isomerase/thioredoxin